MKDAARDTLLSDIINNMQLQMTLLHDHQTEVTNQLPSRSRLAIGPLHRRIIESQIELRGLIVRFNREHVNVPVVIPISYSDSSTPPPSSIRNSIRAVKENKRMTAAISTLIIGVVTLILRHYGLLP